MGLEVIPNYARYSSTQIVPIYIVSTELYIKNNYLTKCIQGKSCEEILDLRKRDLTTFLRKYVLYRILKFHLIVLLIVPELTSQHCDSTRRQQKKIFFLFFPSIA